MAAGFFGFSTRAAAGEATFRPSSTGVRLLAGFCMRGRSVFERAMTRPRSPAAEKSWSLGCAPAAFPSAGYHGDSTASQGYALKAVHEVRIPQNGRAERP